MRIKPKAIIKTLKANEYKVDYTAKTLGIHRSTVYRWINRAFYHGGLRLNKLRRISTKPHNIYYALTPYQKSSVIQLREKKGYTAEKLKYILKLKASISCIQRLLKAK